jgi:hypothetical protein
MSRYDFCWNEREHEDQARRDARWGHRDYDMYDRWADDPCKAVYTEEYDRERRAIERRQEEREEEQRAQERQALARSEREAEEADYNAQYLAQMERHYYEQQQQQYPEPQEPESR